MLRDTPFYITDAGLRKKEVLEAQYAEVVTRECYFAEIVRQQSVMPEGKRRAAAIRRYKAKVERETSG